MSYLASSRRWTRGAVGGRAGQAHGQRAGHLVTGDALVGYLAAGPHAALELLRLLVGRLRESDMQRLDFGVLDTTGRVASFLTGLTHATMSPGRLRLTQVELGESVGASRGGKR